jgi:hypothetical protein
MNSVCRKQKSYFRQYVGKKRVFQQDAQTRGSFWALLAEVKATSPDPCRRNIKRSGTVE